MKKKKEAKAQPVLPKQVINTSAKKITANTLKQKNELPGNDTSATLPPNNTPPVTEKQQVVNEQEQDQVVNTVEEITDVS